MYSLKFKNENQIGELGLIRAARLTGRIFKGSNVTLIPVKGIHIFDECQALLEGFYLLIRFYLIILFYQTVVNLSR